MNRMYSTCFVNRNFMYPIIKRVVKKCNQLPKENKMLTEQKLISQHKMDWQQIEMVEKMFTSTVTSQEKKGKHWEINMIAKRTFYDIQGDEND